MLSLAYLTTATKKEARELVMLLLEEKLIACANIVTAVESYFVWDDEIQKADECLVLMKTVFKNEKKIIRLIKKHHSYQMPCITFLPLENGETEFLKWVQESCQL